MADPAAQADGPRTHDRDGLAGLGVRVTVWTVNQPAQMHRVLDSGMDGVITDRPDLLREVLIARGGWQPPQVTASERES
jgi:glycerophosphoryl diester phosphodiesterase